MANQRPKYITEVVESVNARLRSLKVKDEANALFQWTCDYLLDKKQYRGFNFFKDKVFQNGEVKPIHTGTSDPDKYEYLQIY